MTEHVEQAASAPVAGVVSVVIVNYLGSDDTIACVRALDDLDWPRDRLQVVVVDNASPDDSAAILRREIGDSALVVEAPHNGGFTGGCNLGVTHATGEYIAFLNNDARPHPGWVRSAVATFETNPRIGSVASKVLDWDGKTIDYVDGSLTWFGMGYKREVGRPDSTVYDRPDDVLFATGAAMFVRTQLFRDVGGFDERFFMFYEDVDLGWRLNLLGHRVRYVPTSVAYHKHHATANKFGAFREEYLLERNALLMMYKNYDDDSLARLLAPALALAVRRSIARSETDASMLDLQRSPGGDEEDTVTIKKSALTGPLAIDYLVEQLPGLDADRRRLQGARRRSDRELFSLFRQVIEPAYPAPTYLKAHADLLATFGIEEWFHTRHRIVIVTGEPLTKKMAGPAIRAWEMARALSREHDVVLATLSGVCEISHERFTCQTAGRRVLQGLEQWADVIVFQGMLLVLHPWLVRSKKAMVVDIYDPFHLEVLEQMKAKHASERVHAAKVTTQALNDQLRRGDFFMCASAKQRDFWLGQLASVGRINPHTYDQDETLGELISVVPFGLPSAPPQRKAPAIKGVVPGIDADDKVILWGGGIYNWFDPLSLIDAVGRLAARRPNVRLFFLGMQHPNPDIPEMRMAHEARTLSGMLGLTDKVVFFNEGWVPYENRADFLLDADLGVSTHLDHVETAFSFRTRILDYFWAGLPVVATGGDALGDAIEREDLGMVAAAGDVEALEAALETMLFDEERVRTARANVAAFAPTLTWESVLEPLLRYARQPLRAPDLVPGLGETPVVGRTFKVKGMTVRDEWAKTRLMIADGGIGYVARKAAHKVLRAVDERRNRR